MERLQVAVDLALDLAGSLDPAAVVARLVRRAAMACRADRNCCVLQGEDHRQTLAVDDERFAPAQDHVVAVVGLGEFVSDVSGGDLVIVDGNRGLLILDPDEETLARYEAARSIFRTQESRLEELRDKPAVTHDGRSSSPTVKPTADGWSPASISPSSSNADDHRPSASLMTSLSRPRSHSASSRS